MKLTIEQSGGSEDGQVSPFELKPGDMIAWHDGPAPVKETDPPVVTFRLLAEDAIHVVVRMR
ncbi:MAG: hypothetical protein H0W74_14065 [Sphingosinicella sp.]|nr:hypothetical protein [Sphingosinicella sp.]